MMGGGTINPARLSFALEEGVSEKLAEIGEWLGSSKVGAIRTSVELMETMKNLKSDGSGITIFFGGSDNTFDIKRGPKVVNIRPFDEDTSVEIIKEIRELLTKAEKSLSGIVRSNSQRNEIISDIEQIRIEVEREKPRKKLLITFLESLRDNFAKAAGGAVVAAIGALLAKYFGVF